MFKRITTYTISAITALLLLSSCEDELENQAQQIAEGQQVFENHCADCHDLGEADGKFYLGVTFHLQDLEDYIQSDMPYNETDECDAQCAEDVAAYIQSEMCPASETDLTLCDPDGQTGSESYTNENSGALIANMSVGKTKFEYECSECHNITPDATTSKRGANLFITDTGLTKYFSEDGLKKYIEQNMPLATDDFKPTDCDAKCAEQITLYIQYEFCSNEEGYAFCEGYTPFEI